MFHHVRIIQLWATASTHSIRVPMWQTQSVGHVRTAHISVLWTVNIVSHNPAQSCSDNMSLRQSLWLGCCLAEGRGSGGMARLSWPGWLVIYTLYKRSKAWYLLGLTRTRAHSKANSVSESFNDSIWWANDTRRLRNTSSDSSNRYTLGLSRLSYS